MGIAWMRGGGGYCGKFVSDGRGGSTGVGDMWVRDECGVGTDSILKLACHIAH